MEYKVKTVDEYINQYNGEIKERLQNIRKAILKVDPSLEERVSWQMPTFWKKYNVIHFAVSKNHIGIYPAPEAIIQFSDELKDYKTFKGTIQFPHSKPIPYDLISKIVEFNLGKLH